MSKNHFLIGKGSCPKKKIPFRKLIISDNIIETLLEKNSDIVDYKVKLLSGTGFYTKVNTCQKWRRA